MLRHDPSPPPAHPLSPHHFRDIPLLITPPPTRRHISFYARHHRRTPAALSPSPSPAAAGVDPAALARQLTILNQQLAMIQVPYSFH